jgi:hypothetical protein
VPVELLMRYRRPVETYCREWGGAPGFSRERSFHTEYPLVGKLKFYNRQGGDCTSADRSIATWHNRAKECPPCSFEGP